MTSRSWPQHRFSWWTCRRHRSQLCPLTARKTRPWGWCSQSTEGRGWTPQCPACWQSRKRRKQGHRKPSLLKPGKFSTTTGNPLHRAGNKPSQCWSESRTPPKWWRPETRSQRGNKTGSPRWRWKWRRVQWTWHQTAGSQPSGCRQTCSCTSAALVPAEGSGWCVQGYHTAVCGSQSSSQGRPRAWKCQTTCKVGPTL